jgi:hypothetical protein
MGATAGFVIADATEATRLAELGEYAGQESELVQNAIHDSELEALEAVLLGPSAEPWCNRTLVHAASDDGPWVFRLPDPLTARLAYLTPAEVPAVGAEWAAAMSDPRWFPGWSPAELEESCRLFVADLSGVAGRAVAAGRPLLLWVCM